jgi:hypothetical protein
VDLSVKSKLMLDSIDVWLLTQDSLNQQAEALIAPRCTAAPAAGRWPRGYMAQLGLERRHKV